MKKLIILGALALLAGCAVQTNDTLNIDAIPPSFGDLVIAEQAAGIGLNGCKTDCALRFENSTNLTACKDYCDCIYKDSSVKIAVTVRGVVACANTAIAKMVRE